MRALVVMIALTASARAESPAELEARRHYEAAQKLADQARYGDALAEFQASYALSKYPALLYRIALCQDQLADYPAALDSYQKYLEADPQSPRRAGVEERIDKLRKQLDEAKKPVQPPPVVAHVEKPAPPPPARTPIYKKWWLWTIVGVVAVGAAAGIAAGLTVHGGSSFDPTLGRVGPGAP